jgi:hypothetical protein
MFVYFIASRTRVWKSLRIKSALAHANKQKSKESSSPQQFLLLIASHKQLQLHVGYINLCFLPAKIMISVTFHFANVYGEVFSQLGRKLIHFHLCGLQFPPHE